MFIRLYVSLSILLEVGATLKVYILYYTSKRY